MMFVTVQVRVAPPVAGASDRERAARIRLRERLAGSRSSPSSRSEPSSSPTVTGVETG